MPASLIQPLPIPNQIWEDFTMYFIVGLPKLEVYTAIMVAVDKLTKGAHFNPLKQEFTVTKVGELFIQNGVKIQGFPKSIVTDRDPLFLSKFWREMFTLSGIKLKYFYIYQHRQMGKQKCPICAQSLSRTISTSLCV